MDIECEAIEIIADDEEMERSSENDIEMERAKIEVEFQYPNVEDYSEKHFSGFVHLKCKINNVAEFTETDSLVTPSAMIRGLPFVLIITRIGNKDETKQCSLFSYSKRAKIDTLRFSLVVNDDFKEEWKCRFSVLFCADDIETNRRFAKQINATLKDTRKSLHHDTNFDVVAGLGTFLFSVSITAELPSNWSSVEATKYIGLRNEGATCYINSVLQSLFQITRFREIVFDAPFDEDDATYSFVFALKYIFYLMQTVRLPEVRTIKLIDLFNWEQMTTSDQQDVHEFVRRLIEELENYLKGTEYANSLSELFAGQTRTITDCAGMESMHLDVFWDLTLSVHENADIQEAIESYLKPEEIKDYSFGENRYDAMQKREFTVLPPVLCVSLSRFRYDVKSQQINKNNKFFKFDAELDLSKYIPDSSYTLHSVLVHSGTLNSGHYTVFIDPKCDKSWYKFDDKIVTKCLESNAIEKHFGSRGDTNAYMLIYIKNAAISFVLNSFDRPIPFADTIEAVIKNDQQIIESMKHQCELIVYTPERMGSIKFKRDGKLFETRNKHSFIKLYIDRSKVVKDLYELLFESLRVSKETTHIRILRLSSKCEIDNWKKDRFNEGDQVFDPFTPLENIFNHSRNFLFIQTEPFVQKDELSESLDERVMIFFKHYDANSNSITFFECSFFEIIDAMAKVYDYIREELHLNRNVPLKVYREGGRGILLTEEQLVYSAVADNEDIDSAPITTLVFEIGENGKFQYNAVVSKDMPLTDLNGNINESDNFEKEFEYNYNKKITPTILVNFKLMGAEHEDGHRQCYEQSIRLYKIRSEFADLHNVSSNRMRLFNAVRDEIGPELDELSLEDFIRSQDRRVTRKSVQEATFLYKINELN